MKLLGDRVPSPLGVMLIVSDGTHLCAIDYEDDRDRMIGYLRARFGDIQLVDAADPLGVGSRFRAYFAGALDALDDVPIEPGGTPFQRRVWSALREIPVGTTMTYGGLAARLGAPTASRAVGFANSLNPINIAVPCHRLIGASGALTGYRGGLARKRWLLEHEGVRLAPCSPRFKPAMDPVPSTAER